MPLKEKKYDFWKSKNIIYELGAIRKDSSALMKFKILDLCDLFIETPL